jgi:hypothetical protein
MTRHSTTIEMIEPAPAEVAAGTAFILKFRAWCSSGCDLTGIPIKIVATDGAVESAFTAESSQQGFAEMKLVTPRRAGEHTWSLIMRSTRGSRYPVRRGDRAHQDHCHATRNQHRRVVDPVARGDSPRRKLHSQVSTSRFAMSPKRSCPRMPRKDPVSGDRSVVLDSRRVSSSCAGGTADVVSGIRTEGIRPSP